MTESEATISEATIPRAQLTFTSLGSPFPDIEEVRADVVFIASFDDVLDEPTHTVKIRVPADSWLCSGNPMVKVKGYTKDREQVFAFPCLELDRVLGIEYTTEGAPLAHTQWIAHKDRLGKVFAIRSLADGKVVTADG